MKIRCIIFGASRGGEEAYDLLHSDYDIIGFSDNDQRKWGGCIRGLKIIPPKLLVEYKVLVIIANQYHGAIYRQLKEYGLTDVKVFFLNRLSGSYDLLNFHEKPLFHNSTIKRIPAVGKRINQTGDRILIAAELFPPIGGTSVQRVLKFVKYLSKIGKEITVVTAGDKALLRYTPDNSLLDEIPSNVEILRVDSSFVSPFETSDEMQQRIFDLYSLLVKSKEWFEEIKMEYSVGGVHGKRLIPDNELLWVAETSIYLDKYLDLDRFGVVFTSGGKFSIFLLGAYLKNIYNIKWIMDYRDHWLTNSYINEIAWHYSDEEIRLMKSLEESCVHCSDLILAIGQDILDSIIEEYNISPEKCHLLLNGYDEEDFACFEDSCLIPREVFTICYNGGLYGDRDPIPVIKTVNGIIDAHMIDKSKICIQFIGEIDSEILNGIRKADKYNIIKYSEIMPHKQSISEAMKSNLLLLFGGQGVKGKYNYSGKLFEYIRMNVPILCIGYKESVIDDILKATRTGRVFECNETVGIADYIIECYTNWEKGRDMYDYNTEEIKKYSRENQVGQLSIFIDKLLRFN